MKTKELLAFLEAKGFYHDRDGRHKVMTDGRRSIPVPVHSGDLDKGTLAGILRLAGLRVKDAKEWKERG